MHLAAITGGTGLIGQHLTKMLLEQNITVRILTRNKEKVQFSSKLVEVIEGDLTNPEVIKYFLEGVTHLFHAAAEIKNESIMEKTNVYGTKNLIDHAAKSTSLKYFCHFSSVGVIGKTSSIFVNESTPCLPQNKYETTKYEAEKLVSSTQWPKTSVVILRPTNVISDHTFFQTYKKKSLFNSIKYLIRSGELVQHVHVYDVAKAAIFLSQHYFSRPEILIVSSDEKMQKNTLASILNLKIKISPLVPYFLRLLSGKKTQVVNRQYSSCKLIKLGFRYSDSLQKLYILFNQKQLPNK